ncbi:MAG: trypsin-like peptidase domain-containing protein, partial [Pseudobdellovibrionaceae bacterium]|nr:trypsin-like peptidase domain-containing protein [Pseudobdellovibrionaceae bacterium]
MMNKLLKIIIPSALFLVTACSPPGNSKVKNFYENSTRSEIESIDAKRIVRLTNGCAAFFVENAAGKTILSTARHCVSYNPTEWCNVKDSFTDNEGHIGQCKKIHIDGPEGDIILFEADFPYPVAPENTFRLAGYIPQLESELVMLGYPADLYRNGRPTRTENCKVLSGEKPSVYGDRGNEGGNHRMVTHNCTTYGGNSGGPMFIKGTRDVVGQPATYTPAITKVYPSSFVFGHVNLSLQIVENYRPLLDELKIAISSAPEPIVLVADPVLSEDERDFSSYCSKTDLSPGETASRDALLSLAGTNDCVQASYKLSRITELTLQAKNLTDFRFLSFKIFHTNLVGLYLGGSKIQSLPELEYLKNLKYLDLSNTGFSDFRILGSLTKLNYLLLAGNNLETLAGLPDLSNYSELYYVD